MNFFNDKIYFHFILIFNVYIISIIELCLFRKNTYKRGSNSNLQRRKKREREKNEETVNVEAIIAGAVYWIVVRRI